MSSCVPLAVLSPGSVRQSPDCGLISVPSGCCTHFCPPTPLHAQSSTCAPDAVLSPSMSRHLPSDSSVWLDGSYVQCWSTAYDWQSQICNCGPIAPYKSSPGTSTHLPPGALIGWPLLTKNCWSAAPSQASMSRTVPAAVLPPGSVRQSPDCGLSSVPSSCGTHFCPPTPLQVHSSTLVPAAVPSPSMSRHRFSADIEPSRLCHQYWSALSRVQEARSTAVPATAAAPAVVPTHLPAGAEIVWPCISQPGEMRKRCPAAPVQVSMSRTVPLAVLPFGLLRQSPDCGLSSVPFDCGTHCWPPTPSQVHSSTLVPAAVPSPSMSRQRPIVTSSSGCCQAGIAAPDGRPWSGVVRRYCQVWSTASCWQLQMSTAVPLPPLSLPSTSRQEPPGPVTGTPGPPPLVPA